MIQSQEVVKVAERPHRRLTQFPPMVTSDVIFVQDQNREIDVGTGCVYKMYV